MSDLLPRIVVYLQFAATNTSPPVALPAGCDPPWKLLADAKAEIERQQAQLADMANIVGVGAVGQSFAEITKDLPRRTGESD